MKGKHVHHRIKRCDGGTNDPCNLYVCSEWFHDNVWHEEQGGFTGCASLGARRAHEKKDENGKSITAVKGGLAARGTVPIEVLRETAEYARTFLSKEISSEAGKKGGSTCFQQGLGICGRSPEKMTEDGKKGGKASAAATSPEWKTERGKNMAAKQSREDKVKGGVQAGKIKFQCTVTGYTSTAAGLSHYQKARGINTSLRVRLASQE
jgi:hypothetical protein